VTNVYKNPPLVEALCEFRFSETNPWDVTVFGNYYNLVKDTFPQKRELRDVSMSLQPHERGITGGIKGGGVRMQFVRADQSALVQIAPHRLIINKLKPYNSWEIFKSLIQNRLADYRQVVEQATGRRVGLRYINRFDFSAEGFIVGEHFGPSDLFPPRLRQAGPPFLIRLEIPQNEDDRLLVTMGTAETEEPDQVSVLLDIDYVMVNIQDSSEEDLLTRLDAAHDHIEAVFESCLTADLRRQFNQEV